MNKSTLVLLGLSMWMLAGTVKAEETGFKPNGTFGFTQTFYGNAGGYDTTNAHPSLAFSYNFAPKWDLTLQWDRTWNMYNYTGAENQQDNSFSQPAATLSYNYGNLGDSKINWTSSLMLEYQDDFSGSNQTYLLGQMEFDFAEYIPKSDLIQATQFALAPQYVHGWSTSGPSGSVNTAGLALLTNWSLPANFSLTVNAYAFRSWYNGSFMVGNPSTTYKTANYFMASVWLQYAKVLHQFDAQTSLGFNFIGGLDPYIDSNRNASWDPFMAGNAMYEWLSPTNMEGTYKKSYILFALPQLQLTYQSSKQLSMNLFVGVKYSNQVWGAEEKGWAFQPRVGFGLNFSF